MKHTLWMLLMLLCITSCTSSITDDPVTVDNHQALRDEYTSAREQANKSADMLAKQLDSTYLKTKGESLGEPGFDLVSYLLSLNPDKLSQLQSKLTNTSSDTNEVYNKHLDNLIAVTSREEVDNLFFIVEDYALSGGHSINTVIENCIGKPAIIQRLIIICAAGIDSYVPPA